MITYTCDVCGLTVVAGNVQSMKLQMKTQDDSSEKDSTNIFTKTYMIGHPDQAIHDVCDSCKVILVDAVRTKVKSQVDNIRGV